MRHAAPSWGNALWVFFLCYDSPVHTFIYAAYALFMSPCFYMGARRRESTIVEGKRRGKTERGEGMW